MCSGELWELKASRPLACWNSSLNAGLLRTAVIAVYIKNISCPRDTTVFKAFLSKVAGADIWENASSIPAWFSEKDFSRILVCTNFTL